MLAGNRGRMLLRKLRIVMQSENSETFEENKQFGVSESLITGFNVSCFKIISVDCLISFEEIYSCRAVNEGLS